VFSAVLYCWWAKPVISLINNNLISVNKSTTGFFFFLYWETIGIILIGIFILNMGSAVWVSNLILNNVMVVREVGEIIGTI
jgi:hypothetical protein